MATTSLPPGFRFHPTDVELVKYYLKRKVMGKRFQFDAISELNIYKYCPWDLPDKSCLRSKDLEWYFFCPNERKYASGARTNRATESGYWKSTGRDRPVSYNEQTVGMVKTLVFHKGHAPRGERTDWVMYEYKLQDEELANAGIVQDAYALCKVFQKSGLGPRANAQYGAPFNEEDWDDDADFFGLSLPSNNLLPPELPYNNNDSVGTSMFIPGSSSCGPLSKPGPSNILSLAEEVPPPFPDNGDYICLLDLVEDNSSLVPDHIVYDEVPPPFPDNGDYICLSDLVEANSSLVPDHVVYNEVVENFIDETNNEGLTDRYSMYYNLEDFDNFLGLNGGGFNENNSEGLTCLDNLPELSRGGFDENNEELTSMDGDDIFYSLEDLESGGGFNFSSNQTTEYGMIPFLAGDDAGFFELNDLNYQLNYPIGAAESEEFFIDSFYEPFYNNYLEQDYHPVDIFGEDVPAMNQLPLLPEGFNGHGDHFDLFQENSSVAEIDVLGFTASSRDDNFTPREQPEEGTGDAAEDQNRGQRKSYWRLQHLLESIPAHHASTAEHFAPASHSTYGGSSIHVKAEVTRRSGGCTNDALSQNLGESTYENCGSNLSITGFGKKAVKWGNRFAFFFFAGIISTLIRVFLVPVFTMLSWHAWIFAIRN